MMVHDFVCAPFRLPPPPFFFSYSRDQPLPNALYPPFSLDKIGVLHAAGSGRELARCPLSSAGAPGQKGPLGRLVGDGVKGKPYRTVPYRTVLSPVVGTTGPSGTCDSGLRRASFEVSGAWLDMERWRGANSLVVDCSHKPASTHMCPHVHIYTYIYTRTHTDKTFRSYIQSNCVQT